MLDPTNPLFFEACFPGALSGSREVNCPHCDALLTVPVVDAFGEESYQCCECDGQFVANWAEETVTPTVNVRLNLKIDYEDPEEGEGSG
jgi:DNA-directed RNA polymerase subunit RPC12/RpoP